MHRDLRLILLKRFVNFPLWIVDKLLPFPESAEFPQTMMLERIFARMFKVYRLDCLQGTFSLGRDLKNPPDGNFERFLRVGFKVLARISEDDPYYRKWVGLSMLLAADEWASREKDPQQLKRQIKEMWHMDIDCLSDELIAANVDDFAEDALCDFLGNLARMEVGDLPAFLDQKN